MMNETYCETLKLRSIHCDMFGSWRPGAILEAMQETAGEHSASFGLDRRTMDEMGVAWVLSRTKVEMKRLPVTGETIQIETYPTSARHLFFPRSHVFRDAAGEEIGAANSLWVLMDLQTRRIVKDERVSGLVPDNGHLKPACGMPATVRAAEGEVRQENVKVQFTDLDLNHHVNNTKYLDWCMNALGLDQLEEKCLTAFDVNYEAEILPGSEIRTELTLWDGNFTFCGFAGQQKHFAVGGKMSPRK